MKPWHMIEKAQREHVIRVVESFVAPGSYGLVAEHANAYRAAAALLAEAAPYPDEALVFRYHGAVVDFDGVDDDLRFIWFVFERGERTCGYVHEFTPITPAARDLLDALRGDS